jgi:hypothetical protein
VIGIKWNEAEISIETRSGAFYGMIVPFRGEYYDLIPARSSLVRSLVIPFPIRGFLFSVFISRDALAAVWMPDRTRCLRFAVKATGGQTSTHAT